MRGKKRIRNQQQKKLGYAFGLDRKNHNRWIHYSSNNGNHTTLCGKSARNVLKTTSLNAVTCFVCLEKFQPDTFTFNADKHEAKTGVNYDR